MNEELRGGKILVKADKDLADLIPSFLEKRKNEVPLIAQWLEAEEFSKIQTLGHQLKGAGAGYGFEELSRIGLRLEQSARDRRASEVESTRKALSDYLSRVEVIYDRAA